MVCVCVRSAPPCLDFFLDFFFEFELSSKEVKMLDLDRAAVLSNDDSALLLVVIVRS